MMPFPPGYPQIPPPDRAPFPAGWNTPTVSAATIAKAATSLGWTTPMSALPITPDVTLTYSIVDFVGTLKVVADNLDIHGATNTYVTNLNFTVPIGHMWLVLNLCAGLPGNPVNGAADFGISSPDVIQGSLGGGVVTSTTNFLSALRYPLSTGWTMGLWTNGNALDTSVRLSMVYLDFVVPNQ